MATGLDPLRVSSSSLSNRGGRALNQDCCLELTLERAACWCVADGLGGHAGSEVASVTAVETVIGEFRKQPALDRTTLKSYVLAAQSAILLGQKKDPTLASMHTTLAVVVTDFRSALWAHVGDTRVYHLRKGSVIARTADHSLCQALVEAGELEPEDIPFHRDRSRLLHSLGQPGPLAATILETPCELEAEDSLLLCTDGFWEHVTETEMEVDLAKSGSTQEWLATMWRRLLSKAQEGHDNYSATAIWCHAV